MADSGVVLLDSTTGRRIVRRQCREEGVEVTLLEDLVGAELDQIGKLRKRGLFERFDELLDDASRE